MSRASMDLSTRSLKSGPYSEHEVAFLRDRWLELSHAEMARELDREVHSVRNKCWSLGLVAPNSLSETEVAAIRKAYAQFPVDLEGLASSLNRPKTSICRHARRLGLTDQCRPKMRSEDRKPPRPRKYSTAEELRASLSERTKKYIAENGHPRGALGMKHSQETKEALAKSAAAWWSGLTEEQKGDHILKVVRGKRDAGVSFSSGKRGNWKAAWREVGGQRCFFRSRWEANYARYLEWLRVRGEIASWEHEAQTFWFEGIKRGVVSYLPDFKVVTPGGAVEWHEVKGWMDARSKTTIARMGRYHPKEKLVVIQQRQYDEIRRKLATMIPDWED